MLENVTFESGRGMGPDVLESDPFVGRDFFGSSIGLPGMVT